MPYFLYLVIPYNFTAFLGDHLQVGLKLGSLTHLDILQNLLDFEPYLLVLHYIY